MAPPVQTSDHARASIRTSEEETEDEVKEEESESGHMNNIREADIKHDTWHFLLFNW